MEIVANPVRGLIPTNYPPLQMLITSSRASDYLTSVKFGYKSAIPMMPCSDLINLLKPFTELRKILTYIYQFIIKKYNKRYRWTCSWKRRIGKGMWEGIWSFHLLFRLVALPRPPPIHQPGKSLTYTNEIFQRLHHLGMEFTFYL